LLIEEMPFDDELRRRDLPPEFYREAVTQASPPHVQLYHTFHTSRSYEPAASLVRQGLTFRPIKALPTHMSDDDTHYYNTTGSAAAFWSGRGLPQPTKDLERLRSDLTTWGYCLIGEALSPPQLNSMRARTVDQAAGERAAGVALWLNASARGSTAQFVTTLPNKGDCFVRALEMDQGAVQGAAVIEQLLSEALGGDFLINSFQAIIAHKNGYPQELHQDLNSSGPLQTPEAPLMMSAMFMLDDVGPENGGTLVVPGSHRLVSEAGPGQPVELPPPINVTAPAGTVMLFDARMLHGTGVNRMPQPRHVLLAGFLRTFMRTQEAWHLSASPQLLARASPRLLQRLGFVAHTIGTVEGHGLGASGKIDDPFSSMLTFRLAMDKNSYTRVGELSAASAQCELDAPYTFRSTVSGRRALDKAKKFGLLEAERLALATRLAVGPGEEGDGRVAYPKRGTGSNTLDSRL